MPVRPISYGMFVQPIIGRLRNAAIVDSMKALSGVAVSHLGTIPSYDRFSIVIEATNLKCA